MTPSGRLLKFGWAQADAAKYAREFGRIDSPFSYSTHGAKLYVQAKFKDRQEHLRNRRFDSTIARHHLLGDYDAAVMPPKEPRAIQTDWDAEAEYEMFIRWLRRARAGLSYMAELSPRCGGHVFIPVCSGTRAAEWDQVIREMVIKATGINDSPQLADIARVDTKRMLRLPFTMGRDVVFSTGEVIEIDDPGDALRAWQIWNSLRRHRFATIRTLVMSYRKPGRPRRLPPVPLESLDPSSLGVLEPAPPPPQTIERGNCRVSSGTQVPENTGSCGDSSQDRKFCELPGFATEIRRISNRVCDRVGSMRGRRYRNGAKVVGLLLNMGCPEQALADAALRVFSTTGSKDAANDPDRVRHWLERQIVPWVLHNHRKRS